MHERKVKMLNTKDISHLHRVKVQIFTAAIICNVLILWILFFEVKIALLRPQV